MRPNDKRALMWFLAALLLHVAGVAALRTPGRSQHSGSIACDALFGGGAAAAAETTVVLTADPGTFSGRPEAFYFLAQLRDPVQVSQGLLFCVSAVRGTLIGHPALVVVTGIGQRAAASCATSLLTLCPRGIKEIIFFGTAGCSVQLGGVLNSNACGGANPNTQVVHIGDMCASPFALDGSCRVASWQQQAAGYPDVCSLPQQSAGPTTQDILGSCLFSEAPHGSLELTRELLAAAQGARGHYQARPPALLEYEITYWASMAAGTGVAYDLAPSSQPTPYGMRSCAETDSSFFFEGVPYDMQAREGVAALISQALGTNVTARGVLAFSTMEAVGLLHALQMYHALGRRRPIPHTVLRTCSDYLHSPVRRAEGGGWEEVSKPLYDMAEGYRHAIGVGSTAILHMLQLRCLAAGRGQQACSLLSMGGRAES